MYEYSRTSQNRLAQCHEDLQTIFNEVKQYVNTSILCGHRNEETQNQAVDEGNSELPWPRSKHNSYPSMAVDAGPYQPQLKNLDWEDAVAFGVFAGVVFTVAKQLFMDNRISHQLIWGGDWDSDGRSADETFRDYPHFELTEENVWEL